MIRQCASGSGAGPVAEIVTGAGVANLIASLFPSGVLALHALSRHPFALASAAVAGSWAYALSAVISFGCIVLQGFRRRSANGLGVPLIYVVVGQGLFYLQAFGVTAWAASGR